MVNTINWYENKKSSKLFIRYRINGKRSDECYECPSGATDYPYLLDGPFKSKEEGCNQYR